MRYRFLMCLSRQAHFNAIKMNLCHLNIAPLLCVLIHRVKLFEFTDHFINKTDYNMPVCAMMFQSLHSSIANVFDILFDSAKKYFIYEFTSKII